MKKYLAHIFLALFFGAWTAIPLLGVYWYNEGVPITYLGRTVVTPRVSPGGELKIKISADKAKPSCHAEVTRSIVDAAGTVFDVVTVNRPSDELYTVVVNVPLGASPGRAVYRAKIDWSCNPVQELFPLTILQPELEFEIVPTDGQLQLPDQQGIYQVPLNKSELAKRTIP